MHWKSISRGFCRTVSAKASLLAIFAALGTTSLHAQITNILFSENFELGTIDPLKLVPDAPFFEGGKGNITANVNSGLLEFSGSVTQQYWAGSTLRVVPTFTVSDANQVAIEVDRVYEGGVGTASRSALWIMDSTQTRYILFADVRGEGGWSFNRKIGISGDVPTGGGTQIPAFDGLDDGGTYTMKAVADGQNVRLYLNDTLGRTVPFPFTNIVFHVGSYARANDDTAYTQFDNLRVYSIGAATFEPTTATAALGQTLSNLVVRIPAGLNATTPVQIRVVSSNPLAALPVGAVGDTLTLTFAAGATNAQTINVSALAVGGSTLTLANDIGLAAGNSLTVTVSSPAGINLQDDFASAALDPVKWARNDVPFEPNGTGSFDATVANGQLTISGSADGQYWGGISVRSVPTFTATKDLPLVVEVDRVGIDRTKTLIDGTPSTAARSSLWLANADRSQYIMFAQNLGENGWQVNVNSTGGGSDIPAFNALDGSTNQHRMKLVADGQGVDVYLDDIFGGRFAFPVSYGLHVELGAYTRAIGDEVVAVFDNLKVENTLPCISVDTTDVFLNSGGSSTVNVTIPRLLNATANASVTITSRNPAIAIPQGASGGTLTLNFAAGATNVQAVNIQTVGLGETSFDIASTGVCVQQAIDVAVTSVTDLLLSDGFNGTTLSNAWSVETTALVEGATATVDSGVVVSNNTAIINVTAETASWPGFTVVTTNTFDASVTHPAVFEIDRESIGFALTTGTSAKQLSGIWVSNADRTQLLFFGELTTHDGSAGGWQYIVVNETNLFPATAVGTSISAFTEAQYNDRGSHRLTAVANGQNVRLFLDGTFGAEVPFPVADDIRFGFGTYVLAATDVAVGTFANATVEGTAPTNGGGAELAVARATNGDVTITWDAPGTLQSSETLAPGSFTPVTPAPTGNTYTVPTATQGSYRFFRVVTPAQ